MKPGVYFNPESLEIIELESFNRKHEFEICYWYFDYIRYEENFNHIRLNSFRDRIENFKYLGPV